MELTSETPTGFTLAAGSVTLKSKCYKKTKEGHKFHNQNGTALRGSLVERFNKNKAKSGKVIFFNLK